MDLDFEDILRGLRRDSRWACEPEGDLRDVALRHREVCKTLEGLVPLLLEFEETPASLGDLASFLMILREEFYLMVSLSHELQKEQPPEPPRPRRKRRCLRP